MRQLWAGCLSLPLTNEPDLIGITIDDVQCRKCLSIKSDEKVDGSMCSDAWCLLGMWIMQAIPKTRVLCRRMEIPPPSSNAEIHNSLSTEVFCCWLSLRSWAPAGSFFSPPLKRLTTAALSGENFRQRRRAMTQVWATCVSLPLILTPAGPG